MNLRTLLLVRGLLGTAVVGIVLAPWQGLAQVLPDATLGAEGSIVTPLDANTDRIDGGALQNSLLFHSFEGFSIPEGHGVYFANPVGVNRIFSRVTGADPSRLFGTLGVLGEADLLFLNPNGILFGPNAQLDLRGAFTATTATGVVFPGGERFDAVAPGAAPLLTVNVEAPVGVVFEGVTPAAIVNQGELVVDAGQALMLIGGTVVNTGQLIAPGSEISVTAVPENSLLSFSDVELPLLSSEGSSGSAAHALATLIDGSDLENANIPIDFQLGTVAVTGSVDASSAGGDGGSVAIAGNRIRLLDGAISAEGIVGGQLRLLSSLLENRGEVLVDGEVGGTLNIDTGNFLDAGVLSARGSAGDGGTIQVDYDGTMIQTASALTDVTGSEVGGRIGFQGGRVLTTSGTLEAKGEFGGDVHLFGERLQLLATEVNASGDSSGGEILVGGDYQGNTIGAENALNTLVNHAATLEADALVEGDGGRVIVWADRETEFYGSVAARGGEPGGNGGVLEVSGRERLVFGGFGDASAANGSAGTLLLDPQNIVIEDGGAVGFAQFDLIDPNAGNGTGFGGQIETLGTGNVVVTKPGDNFIAENAGAVYLYDGSTGSLISTITGSQVEDRVGSDRVTPLSNGNFVVRSPDWNNDRGAVTWGNGTTGVTGIVGIDNSLVGIQPGDQIGGTGRGVFALNNGNYVVASSDWNNNRGAVTWGNGLTGLTGIVGIDNSLMGVQPGDRIGGASSFSAVVALNNGNYVVRSPNWNDDRGAVTWGNGTNGITGFVEANNSLVGVQSGDRVGSGFGLENFITELSNGNYVVRSPDWSNERGAVTWGNGTTGITGVVGSDNSLIGTQPSDRIGNSIDALSNGNYVVGSPNWINNRGAVTWGNGTTGITGFVGENNNSLIGTQPGDRVGNSIHTLSNGNYVVRSPEWNNERGAVTWGNSTTGITGVVGIDNSLGMGII